MNCCLHFTTHLLTQELVVDINPSLKIPENVLLVDSLKEMHMHLSKFKRPKLSAWKSSLLKADYIEKVRSMPRNETARNILIDICDLNLSIEEVLSKCDQVISS